MTTSVQQQGGQMVMTTTEKVCDVCTKPYLDDLPGFSFLGTGAVSRWAWDDLPDLDALDRFERHLDEDDCGGHSSTDLF